MSDELIEEMSSEARIIQRNIQHQTTARAAADHILVLLAALREPESVVSPDHELREAIEEVLSRGHTAAYDLRNDIQAVLGASLDGRVEKLAAPPVLSRAALEAIFRNLTPRGKYWEDGVRDGQAAILESLISAPRECPNGPQHRTGTHPIESGTMTVFGKPVWAYEADEFCPRCGTPLSAGSEE